MLTAIIINYHGHQLTIRAVASVLADQPDAQVIVVDNSESESEAQALQNSLPSGVECLVSPRNIGFGRGCNLAYSRARYDFILLLNPDAFVLPGCLPAMLDFLLQTASVGAVSPKVYWDAEQTWLAPPILMHTPFSEAGMAVLLRFPWLGSRISWLFRSWALRCIKSDSPIERSMLSGGHILLRRQAIESAGGLFDPAFFLYFEDTDLCRRLCRSGSRLCILPNARAVHEWHCSSTKTDVSAASHQYYFKKHFSGSLLLLLRSMLEKSRLKPRLPFAESLGNCTVAPTLSVPEHIHDEWVLELSPQPLLIPALYYFGNGKYARIPDELWHRLGSGHYWARIGSLNGKQCCRFYNWSVS